MKGNEMKDWVGKLGAPTAVVKDDLKKNRHLPLAGFRLCICTPDYVHLVKNGGIGTSFYHTARTLQAYGAEVTILYSNRTDELSEAERMRAGQSVAAEGARLEFLFPHKSGEVMQQFYPGDVYTVGSYLVYRWLKTKSFDVVLFPDWRGLAYYSVHAKREGLAFFGTELWIQGHSSSLWSELNNHSSSFTELDVRVFHFERKSIEMCDRFLSATQYLLDWKLEHGFKVPAKTEVLPLILNSDLLPHADRVRAQQRSTASAGSFKEIVFFGRLEKRKGLQIFIQAIERLFSRHEDFLEQYQLRFTFLGKIVEVDGMSSVEYIDRHLSRLSVRYGINPSLSAAEAISYISAAGAIAVISSLADNSPLTVHECMDAGIPFLASNVGGIPEIVHADDHAQVLFRPLPHTLTDAIVKAVTNGLPVARPSVSQSESNIPRWIALLLSARDAKVNGAIAPNGRVSVCVTHYERPLFLRRTLEGLAAQTYKNFEVLLVDNGSKTPDAAAFLANVNRSFPTLDIKVHQLPDLFPGAARNLALRESTGDYFLVMDDDNYAHPDQIKLFLQAMTTSGFDALTCGCVLFPDHIDDPSTLTEFIYLYMPAGSGVSVNLFSNLYGDANGFFRKSALEAVGGFTEERSSWEDYEVYSALENAGFRTGVVPEPLVYLRNTTGSVSRSGTMLGNYYRALRPALKRFPWHTFGDALLVALNGSLKNCSAVNFFGAGGDDEKQILHNSGDPLVISRLLVRRTFAAGHSNDVVQHLQSLARSSPSLSRLDLDAFLCLLAVDDVPGAEAYADSSTISPDTAALAKAYLRSLEEGDFTVLSEALAKLGNRRPLNADEHYLAGLTHILCGDAIAGFKVWKRMLDVEEKLYLGANPDVGHAITLKHARSGVSHFLRSGHAEARPFSYTWPVRHALARDSLLSPKDYLPRIGEVFNLKTVDAIVKLRELTFDIIVSGSVFAAAEMSDYMLELAENRYLQDHPDVAAAIADNKFGGSGGAFRRVVGREGKGTQQVTGGFHWNLHGRGEGRPHLVGSLASFGVSGGALSIRKAVPGPPPLGRKVQGSLIADWI